METCIICNMPIKSSLKRPMTSWLVEESQKQREAGLFISVFAPQHPKNTGISNLCDRCRKDVNAWLQEYKEKRREETKNILWKNLETSL